MESAEKACNWLCVPESKVSCHYLVDQDGGITQMVGEEMRAWHAGVSSWEGETDINSCSIGIEVQNTGHGGAYEDFPEAQMDAVADLASDIVSRHKILPQHVLAHSDIAPERKIDPGEKFDWRFMHGRGVGHWVPPVTVSGGVFLQQGDRGDPVLALQGMLSLYGYGIVRTGQYDEQTRRVVEAFQRHFRPSRVDGIADHSTVATLHALLQSRPAMA
ncbi:MAG: N-acetylmuramoyl-L-alanine amidase [Rhizobiales bacterium]|nr:N-acetylmuramoyl-L-alanine amidase [Hyphomicrobiales bacterium]